MTRRSKKTSIDDETFEHLDLLRPFGNFIQPTVKEVAHNDDEINDTRM